MTNKKMSSFGSIKRKIKNSILPEKEKNKFLKDLEKVELDHLNKSPTEFNTILSNYDKKQFLKDFDEKELGLYIRTAPSDIQRIIFKFTGIDQYRFNFLGAPLTPNNFCKFFKVSKEFYKAYFTKKTYTKLNSDNLDSYKVASILDYTEIEIKLNNIYMYLHDNTEEIEEEIAELKIYLDKKLKNHSKKFYDNMMEKIDFLKRKTKRAENWRKKELKRRGYDSDGNSISSNSSNSRSSSNSSNSSNSRSNRNSRS